MPTLANYRPMKLLLRLALTYSFCIQYKKTHADLNRHLHIVLFFDWTFDVRVQYISTVLIQAMK